MSTYGSVETTLITIACKAQKPDLSKHLRQNDAGVGGDKKI